ncbi:MAG: hypothetical protein RLZZ267_500 [Bacillota bacterium]|jgi:hypothetical protein
MKKSTALLFASGTVVLYVLTGLALSLDAGMWALIAFGASIILTAAGFIVKAKSNRAN